MADGLTKQDLIDALTAVGFKSPGSTIGGTSAAPQSGGGGGGFSAADKAAKDLGGTLSEKLTGAAAAAGKGLSEVSTAVNQNIGVWRDLSSRGANFGNDIVGMSTAASGSRVSLQEFAQTIADNNTSFIGLGGNVGHGSQKFAALTAEMYDNFSPVTDQLRQQGFSNKELNDVLALQIGFQRGSFKDDKESKAASIKSATDLAEEMGALAQLTGVSRKEQEEALKKESVNAQVESKFRLIAATEGEEAAGKARLAYAKNFAEANARGEGQRFREIFATGHEVTKEAAAQGAMLGKQAQATAEQARASAKGNMDEADKYNRLAREGQLENSKNITLLTMGTYGEAAGAAGKISQDMVTHTRGVYDSEAKIRQEAAFKNATTAEIAAEQERRARAAGLGKDKEGADQAGSATTKAAVNIEQRMNDASSAVMKSLVTPLNEKAGPAINKFADTAAGATQKLSNGQVVTTPQANNMAVQQGMQGTGGGQARPTGLANQVLNTVGTVGRGAEATGEAAGKVKEWFDNATSSKPPQKADGGIVPGTDKGTTVTVGEKGKPEAIVPLDQLKTSASTEAQGASPVGGMPSNEELKAKAEEAIRIIKEHGQGSFDTQVRITSSGNLRLREQFDEHNNRMQSLGDTSTRERIEELVKQADALKVADKETALSRFKEITEGQAAVEDAQKQFVKDKTALEIDTYGEFGEIGKAQLEEMLNKGIANSDTTSINVQGVATPAEIEEKNKKIALPTPETAKAEALARKAAVEAEQAKMPAELPIRKLSINDMMGDMIDKMAGDIDVKGISKNIKTSVSTTDPREQAAIDKAEKDKRYIAENKAKEEQSKKSQISSAKPEHKASLDDVVAALMMLNKLMSQQVDHSAGMIKATKSLSGNKLARG
jgi:hypothetical protein